MKALRTFISAADPLHIYHAGDVYPRPGIEPGGEHVQSLLADGLIAAGEAEKTEPAKKPARAKAKKEG